MLPFCNFFLPLRRFIPLHEFIRTWVGVCRIGRGHGDPQAPPFVTLGMPFVGVDGETLSDLKQPELKDELGIDPPLKGLIHEPTPSTSLAVGTIPPRSTAQCAPLGSRLVEPLPTPVYGTLLSSSTAEPMRDNDQRGRPLTARVQKMSRPVDGSGASRVRIVCHFKAF